MREPVPTKEWVEATIFVLVTAAAIVAALVWFAMTFLFQTCTVPTCALPTPHDIR